MSFTMRMPEQLDQAFDVAGPWETFAIPATGILDCHPFRTLCRRLVFAGCGRFQFQSELEI